MFSTCRLLTAALILATVAPLLPAQDDPVLQELQRTLKQLGGRPQLERNAAYKQSRLRWPEYQTEIAAAVKKQDDASTPAAVNELKTIYGARARSRGEVIDRYLYGRLLGGTGDLAGAYEHFKAALQMDTYFFWAWDALGVYYIRKSDHEQATSCFERALQINPRFLKAALGLVQAYMERRNYTAAALKLQELINWDEVARDTTAKRQVRLYLADCYRNLADFPRAIIELGHAIEEFAFDPLMYAMRAHCYKKLEKYAEAARDYEEIVARVEREYRYHFELARCYGKLGRNADAAHSLEKGLKVGDADLEAESKRSIQEQIDRLKTLPAIENPKNKRLGLDDWINRLHHGVDDEKRREAILFLAKAPLSTGDQRTDRKIDRAFLEALRDRDPFVLAKAIEQIAMRWSWNPDSVKLPALFIDHGDARVRGMVCYVLPAWDSPRSVPLLMKGINDEDEYVFRMAHESLNMQTLAWISRILPEEMSKEEMAGVRKQWQAWYRKNRDAYRKYEDQPK